MGLTQTLGLRYIYTLSHISTDVTSNQTWSGFVTILLDKFEYERNDSKTPFWHFGHLIIDKHMSQNRHDSDLHFTFISAQFGFFNLCETITCTVYDQVPVT